MMKFYRENQVNPLGSCLPLLLQLPVFISLFYMLRTDLKHDMCPGIGAYAKSIDKDLGSVTCSSFQDGFNAAHPHAQVHFDTGFLFIPDLTAKATGAVLITLIILYIGTQLASSLLMSVTADRTQRLIFMALPFIFVPFIINFPAGLLVYWITTNTWTIGQQLLIRKVLPPPHLKDKEGHEIELPPEPEHKKGLGGMIEAIRESAGLSDEDLADR